ncbi:MAG: RNA polymerase subunit sigma [Planctomycetes bacterium]|nr:RNA polymerase subunit sigma [Planctomycetota bacterium]
MEDPDVALMLAFQQGDYDAFGQLVEQHMDSVVNYFFFQCRDRDLAEDCTQEVWAKLFRSRQDYQPRARFSTYLFRVARNHWIDRFRSLSRRPGEARLEGDGDGAEDDGAGLIDRLPVQTDDPEAGIRAEEAAELLARALRRLPGEMREVYLLGEVEALPYAEVSTILAIPIGTVKSRMFNAVRKLEEILGGLRGEDS